MRFGSHRIKEFVKFYIRANTIYDVHSPFLYEFLMFTTDESRLYYQYQELDGLRLRLQLNASPIRDDDPGAGSHVSSSQLTVGDVAKTAISSQQQCEWLYRVMMFLQPQCVLELGTSLGISALYMAAPLAKGTVHTLEGRRSIANLARQTITSSSVENITIIEGLFEDTLDDVLESVAKFDFVVLDGNHRYEPTIEYASKIIDKHSPKYMLIDDIYWSPEMTDAWKMLKTNPHYNVVIDFYDFGLLLHRPEINSRIEISFIEYYKKFWRMGFF